MLVFIVPFKSQQASKNWGQACLLLERCLRSVCNQTSAAFKVIVVCHQQPEIAFNHPNIVYVSVSYPIPQNPDIRTKRRDRVRKVLVGTVYAKDFDPTYLMKVDADDYVSRRLVEFVEKNASSHGWLMPSGYEYSVGDRSIYLRKEKFYLHCGTSNIVQYKLLDLPHNPETMDYDELFRYHLPHSKVDRIFRGKGLSLEMLPFPGAIYVLNNGENTYLRNTQKITIPQSYKELMEQLRQIYRGFKSQRISNAIQEEFNLTYSAKLGTQ